MLRVADYFEQEVRTIHPHRPAYSRTIRGDQISEQQAQATSGQVHPGDASVSENREEALRDCRNERPHHQRDSRDSDFVFRSQWNRTLFPRTPGGTHGVATQVQEVVLEQRISQSGRQLARNSPEERSMDGQRTRPDC